MCYDYVYEEEKVDREEGGGHAYQQVDNKI